MVGDSNDDSPGFADTGSLSSFRRSAKWGERWNSKVNNNNNLYLLISFHYSTNINVIIATEQHSL